MIQLVSVEEAVGLPLAHNITVIRPGEFKGPAFRRGRVLKEYEVEHMCRLREDDLLVSPSGMVKPLASIEAKMCEMIG